MQNEILTEAASNARNGEINLGTANGWRDKTNELYAALRDVAIPNSGSTRNLGRCWNEYSFDVIINEQTYTVVYQVDSGD